MVRSQIFTSRAELLKTIVEFVFEPSPLGRTWGTTELSWTEPRFWLDLGRLSSKNFELDRLVTTSSDLVATLLMLNVNCHREQSRSMSLKVVVLVVVVVVVLVVGTHSKNLKF